MAKRNIPFHPDFSNVISWILSAASIFIAILSFIGLKSVGIIIAFVVTLGEQVLLLYLWGEHMSYVHSALDAQEELEEHIRKLEDEKRIAEEKLKATGQQWQTQIAHYEEVISMNFQNASKLNNEFYVKIPATTE